MGRVPQVHTVHGQDRVPHIQRLGLVRSEPLEYFTDEDGHLILLPPFDANPESPDFLLGHLDAPLFVGDRFGYPLREVRERGAHSLGAIVGVGITVVMVRSVGNAVRVDIVIDTLVNVALTA